MACVICLILCGLNTAWAQYDFRAACPEGQLMYFKIHADSATVSVTHPGPNWPYYDPGHKMHGAVTVPQEVEWQGRRYRVTAVAPNAFYRNDSLTAISLPQLTAIGSQAFCDCAALAVVNMPVGLAEIGDGAFAACRSLESIELPATLRRIGTSAFALCTGLVQVRLASGFDLHLDSSIFAGCSGIDEGKNMKKMP